MSGAIRGRHNIYAHMESLIKNAENTVTIVTTGKGLVRKNEALKAVLERLKKKNVKIRIAANLTKASLDAAKQLSKIAEVRSTSKVNARFCIIDNKDLVFMMMSDENVHPSYDVGVWVKTPLFTSALESMFDLAWKEMTPLDKVKV